MYVIGSDEARFGSSGAESTCVGCSGGGVG